jgi:hypothetical protein
MNERREGEEKKGRRRRDKHNRMPRLQSEIVAYTNKRVMAMKVTRQQKRCEEQKNKSNSESTMMPLRESEKKSC